VILTFKLVRSGCEFFGHSDPQEGQVPFAGMGVPEIRRLQQLEDENSKLKRLVADLTLDRAMLQRAAPYGR
jgi:putative transposase